MEVDWKEIVTTLIAIANTAWIIWSSYKKNKPEVKKLELETDSELVEAANANLEGAKISGEMLLSRINELKADLESEKQLRKADAEYFRRRLTESEREARDYRVWAAKLAKQVIEAGRIPAAFIPSINESERGIPTIPTKDIVEQQRKEDNKR